MSSQQTAYVTGGASGIGRAVAEMLAKKGMRVCIADQDLSNAQKTVSNLSSSDSHLAVDCDVGDWDSQRKAFEQAIKAFGRIDYVYPIAGIGEKKFMPNDPSNPEFVKPMLSVIDIDLTGVIYTCSLAVQQMRRQEKDPKGFRGKIAVTASVCGFYCVPTVPVYTAAKHGVVGFVRSFGKYLPEEGMTMNAVCPNVVRTHISSDVFYDKVEPMGLLVPVQNVVDAFESFIDSDISGECMEVGPMGGFVRRAPAEYLDDKSKETMDLVGVRSRPLHEAFQQTT